MFQNKPKPRARDKKWGIKNSAELIVDKEVIGIFLLPSLTPQDNNMALPP